MSDHPALDLSTFLDRVVEGYNKGTASCDLPADDALARSAIPPATAAARDFSYIAPELPEFIRDKCVGCMECVTECPDTAILGRVVEESKAPAGGAAFFARPKKYAENMAAKGIEPGLFGLFVDPTKCKGCAECVAVCGDRGALRMVTKTPEILKAAKRGMELFYDLKETPAKYIVEKSLMDMMLSDRAMLYVGGAGSCMGCGEGSAIRMMLAATGFAHGAEIGIVASTGCNSVFGSTYPYNPYRVAWMNSLFENAPTVAMGLRAAWDRLGWASRRLWVIGGDGAMNDIGFQSLSRLLMSGMDLKVLVLDTQVYSNTGGQSSGSTFAGQATSFSHMGKEIRGKQEGRKELGLIALMHPNVYVAQTTPAHPNHFYKAVMEANAFPGPALVNVYAACMPEHGIADDRGAAQAKLAVESRAFPIFLYDPRKGGSYAERLDLKANPAPHADWWTRPKSGEVVDFVSWARTEQRFAGHFDKEGKPSEMILRVQEERLQNWRRLQELAGKA